MKIALIGRYGEGEILSGPERVARELFDELKIKNVEVTFIEYFFSDYKDSSFVNKLLKKKHFNSQNLYRLGIIPIVIKFKKNEFDVIHFVNSQRFELLFVFLKYLFRGKIVTTFHGLMSDEIPEGQLLKNRYFLDFWIERLLIKISDELIFPSELLYDKFHNKYTLRNKFKIIPNAASSIFFDKRFTFPEIQDEIKMVFYNGIESSINRGLDDLLIQLEGVKFPSSLFVIGDAKIINSMNQNVKVNFVSPMNQKDLINFLRDKHFIVKSKTLDTFSLFVAECMTIGIIPIVHKNTGIIDYIESEINGFIYSEEKRLSELLNQITDNKYNLEYISNNARRIIDKLNWNEIALKYLNIYQTVR